MEKKRNALLCSPENKKTSQRKGNDVTTLRKAHIKAPYATLGLLIGHLVTGCGVGSFLKAPQSCRNEQSIAFGFPLLQQTLDLAGKQLERLQASFNLIDGKGVCAPACMGKGGGGRGEGIDGKVW